MENFGQYQLLEKIAEGGMAELYLAKSSKLQGLEKYLIIKRILPKYSGSEELIKMFVNEAKINMNMSHNNIVSIFDFGIESGRFFIAMEYIQGQNLKSFTESLKLLGEEPVSLPEKVYILTQAALGLDYAHRCKDIATGTPLNIVHRDVGTENIMICKEGNVKIIDFGVAVDSENNDRSAQEGKFSYMSPEQANGQKPITAQTDIFSLGVVLWELLAGQKMYSGKAAYEILNHAKKCEYRDIRDFNDEVSDELAGILKKALEKNKEDRYKTMNEFYIDLNRYLNLNYPDFTVESLKEKVCRAFEKEATSIQRTMTNVLTSFDSSASAGSYADDRTVVMAPKERVRRKISGRVVTKRKKRIKKAS